MSNLAVLRSIAHLHVTKCDFPLISLRRQWKQRNERRGWWTTCLCFHFRLIYFLTESQFDEEELREKEDDGRTPFTYVKFLFLDIWFLWQEYSSSIFSLLLLLLLLLFHRLVTSYSALWNIVLHVCCFPGNRKERIRWISGVKRRQRRLCFPVTSHVTLNLMSSRLTMIYHCTFSSCTKLITPAPTQSSTQIRPRWAFPADQSTFCWGRQKLHWWNLNRPDTPSISILTPQLIAVLRGGWGRIAAWQRASGPVLTAPSRASVTLHPGSCTCWVTALWCHWGSERKPPASLDQQLHLDPLHQACNSDALMSHLEFGFNCVEHWEHFTVAWLYETLSEQCWKQIVLWSIWNQCCVSWF